MKAGQGPVRTGAKWKASCWVTTRGGNRTCPPSSGSSQAPAATITTGARHRDRAHCHHRALGVEHPAIRVEHDWIGPERHPGPALGGGRGRDQFGGDPERGQDVVYLLLLAGRAEVDGAGGHDKLLARLLREPPPPLLSLAGQPHIERVGVGTPEDPGAAV